MWLDWICGVALLLWRSLAGFCGPSPAFVLWCGAFGGLFYSKIGSQTLVWLDWISGVALMLWCSLARFYGPTQRSLVLFGARKRRSLALVSSRIGSQTLSGALWRSQTLSGALWRSLAGLDCAAAVSGVAADCS